jgi:hypothetical protein
VSRMLAPGPGLTAAATGPVVARSDPAGQCKTDAVAPMVVEQALIGQGGG